MDPLDDMYSQVERVVREVAPTIRPLYQESLRRSLKRSTGKSYRNFTPIIRKDGLEVWGVSFSTLRYVYMHHHGMQRMTVSRGGRNYQSRGYAKLSLLTPPSQRGAVILADAITPVMADVFVKSMF